MAALVLSYTINSDANNNSHTKTNVFTKRSQFNRFQQLILILLRPILTLELKATPTPILILTLMLILTELLLLKLCDTHTNLFHTNHRSGLHFTTMAPVNWASFSQSRSCHPATVVTVVRVIESCLFVCVCMVARLFALDATSKKHIK